jgi:hypothetical protein
MLDHLIYIIPLGKDTMAVMLILILQEHAEDQVVEDQRARAVQEVVGVEQVVDPA